MDDLDTKEKVRYSSFGVGALVSNQWIFKSRFVIDLGGGLMYQNFSYKDGEGDAEFSSLKGGGIFPALSFSLVTTSKI